MDAKRAEEERLRREEEARARAEAEAKARADLEAQRKLRAEAEKRKQLQQRMMQLCPMGFGWYEDGWGWHCYGGTHHIPK